MRPCGRGLRASPSRRRNRAQPELRGRDARRRDGMADAERACLWPSDARTRVLIARRGTRCGSTSRTRTAPHSRARAHITPARKARISRAEDSSREPGLRARRQLPGANGRRAALDVQLDERDRRGLAHRRPARPFAPAPAREPRRSGDLGSAAPTGVRQRSPRSGRTRDGSPATPPPHAADDRARTSARTS